MSTKFVSDDALSAQTFSLPSKAQPLLSYLDTQLRDADVLYVKSRFIADEIELSAKEIGAYLGQLSNRDGPLTVEEWSYTGGTTWRVTAV